MKAKIRRYSNMIREIANWPDFEVHPSIKENENLDSLSHFLTERGFVQSISREGEMGYIWAWRE